MLTLVHAPRSRSSRFLWLLEEIGEPYDIQLSPSAASMGLARSIPRIRILTAKSRS
jgi:hypothetical protein